MPTVKRRISHLLKIKRSRNFKKQFSSKRMFDNCYNAVDEMTEYKSEQERELYLNAYMLAYYGYLKDRIKQYQNTGEQDGQTENVGFIEDDEFNS
jgi:hypothetical protein